MDAWIEFLKTHPFYYALFTVFSLGSFSLLIHIISSLLEKK